jgi:hypothetical protein
MKPVVRRAHSLVVVVALGVAALAFAGARGSVAGEATPVERERHAHLAEVEAAIDRTGVTGRVEAALGDDFGGVWFEPSTAQLHFGVVTSFDRGRVEAIAERVGLGANVTASPVRSTWAELVAGQELINEGLADLFVHEEVSTGLRADLNAVSVKLAPTVPAPRRTALERMASADGIAVAIDVVPHADLRLRREARCAAFEEDRARCEPTIVAGMTIETAGGAKCTAGPAVRPTDHKKPTETLILTAGHCLQNNGGLGVAWFAYNKKGEKGEKTEIGKSVEWKHGAVGDVGLIRVDNPGAWSTEKSFIPVEPTIAPWNEAAPEPQVVKGSEGPEKGRKVCLAGQTSGRVCGNILETEVKSGIVEGLVEVGAGSAGGDSGGPWYSEAAIGTVQGTHVGSLGGNAVYEPIDKAFEILNTKVELLKEANRSRHAFKLEVENVPATLTGKQPAGNAEFTFAAGVVKCPIVTYIGSRTEKARAEIELTPAYGGCKLGANPASVNVNECKFFFAVTKLEGATRAGSMDIFCPSGKALVFTPTVGGVPICTIHLPTQFGKNAVTFTNTGAGATRELIADVKAGGLTYTQTAGMAPGACGNLHAATGIHSATVQVTGESGATHLGVFAN